jgi:hypothetical protein
MNRKVVWNACYGGFNLSPRAEKMLYEKKHPGETVYFYKEVYEGGDFRTHTYLRVDEKDLDLCDAFSIHCVSLDFGKEIILEDGSIEDKRFNNHYIWNTEIERHDPDLVAVVEELGSEKASGKCARLRVMDIGEEHYHISEYDGYESVITELGDDYWI